MEETFKLNKLFLFALFAASCLRVSVGASVCDEVMLTDLEIKCETTYENATDTAQEIENDTERKEAVCCALDDFESCNMEAYDIANCQDQKENIKDTLKAAKLFLSAMSGVTCNIKKQCSSSSSVLVPSWCLVLLVLSFNS